MTTTREQQRAWLQDNWGLPEEQDETQECDNGCGRYGSQEQPLFMVAGLWVCSAECGAEALESYHQNLDDWGSQAGDFHIYEDLQAMVDGNWPPRKPIEELRAALEQMVTEAIEDMRGLQAVRAGYHKQAYEKVLALIDRLTAGESLEEQANV